MRRNGSILVIDDEEIMREILDTLLSREGYDVKLASNGAEGLELAKTLPFDAVIVDVMMPGMDGVQTLDELKKLDDDLPVLMITAFASVENAIAAMKRGAFDYITKPFKNDEVLVVLRNAVERRRLVAENTALRQNLQAQYHKFSGIIGRSPRMKQVFDLIIQAAPSRSTILITGESGTGKELVARAIHTNSARSDRAFVTVNSGNLPPDLLESTLFGHVKGAFTGAVYPKKGLCDMADKGSIFFDEIGNIPAETQAKLLRVMQEREFMRLGGMETIRVDVRIIAATNCDLHQMMEEGRFREDLYYRLHVISIYLPPLRERKEDIPLLAQHFLEKYGVENKRPGLELTADALDLMMDYDWPGNVRELENVIERAVVLTSGSRIGADLIPDHVRKAPTFQIPQFIVPPEGISFKEVITDFEKRLIESTLEAAGGVQKRAAELLHIKPTTLNEMIKRYDIRPRRKKAGSAASTEEPAPAAAAAPAGPSRQAFSTTELSRD
jgi:DNA-binding NtrC family response regulator